MPRPTNNHTRRARPRSAGLARCGLAGAAALSLSTAPLLGEDAAPETASHWLPAFAEAGVAAESAVAGVAGWWQGVATDARARLDASLGLFVLDGQAQPGAEASWVRPEENLAPRAVVLVHGLDDPGTIWIDLAPALAEAGHQVVRFDYPNDQAIGRSADELWVALGELRARGVERIDIVAHSMGGLVARDVLTRGDYYAGSARASGDAPGVGRLIMIGTPNAGSELARFRAVMEWRDWAVRWWGAEEKWDLNHLAMFIADADGDGQAGTDLLPGSEYLEELNARGLPRGVELTAIIGRAGAEPGPAGAWGAGLGCVARVIGGEPVERLESTLQSIASLVGDGAVSSHSAALEGTDDLVYLGADHRSLVRRVSALEAIRSIVTERPEDPPAFAPILDRLADPARSGDHGSPETSARPDGAGPAN